MKHRNYKNELSLKLGDIRADVTESLGQVMVSVEEGTLHVSLSHDGHVTVQRHNWGREPDESETMYEYKPAELASEKGGEQDG